jgi:hypothetical protein
MATAKKANRTNAVKDAGKKAAPNKKVAAAPAGKTKPVAGAKGKLNAKAVDAKPVPPPVKKGFPAKKTGAAARKRPARKPIPTFKAPAEFKPFFMRVTMLTAKDGIITDVKATRIKGSPTNENAKTLDLSVYDPDTERRMATRFAGPTFIRNDSKRLPGNAKFDMLMRVGARKADDSLMVALREARMKVGKDGKAIDIKKDKKTGKPTVEWRTLRKALKFMPAAFTKVLPFPSAAEIKALYKRLESAAE